jgi:hypothetical protein
LSIPVSDMGSRLPLGFVGSLIGIWLMIRVIVIKGIGDIYLFGVPNFVKCCIYCKNSVYLKSLVYCYESSPSSHVPQMKWHSEHITIIRSVITGMALFALSPFCPYHGKRQWRKHVRRPKDMSQRDG